MKPANKLKTQYIKQKIKEYNKENNALYYDLSRHYYESDDQRRDAILDRMADLEHELIERGEL